MAGRGMHHLFSDYNCNESVITALTYRLDQCNPYPHVVLYLMLPVRSSMNHHGLDGMTVYAARRGPYRWIRRPLQGWALVECMILALGPYEARLAPLARMSLEVPEPGPHSHRNA